MGCNKKIIFGICGCVAVLAIAILVFVFWKNIGENCTLPNNKTALCVAIDKCETMNSFLNESQLAPYERMEIFRRHLCGPGTNKTKLCCPRESILLEVPNQEEDSGMVHRTGITLNDESVRHRTRLTPVVDTPITCSLPNNVTANCIPISMCQSIQSVMKSGNLNKSKQDNLRPYQCESSDNGTHVCCPSELDMVEMEDELTPTTSPPVMVRNSNLLPIDCGITTPEQRITRGTRAVLYEFPWMALLSYQTSKGAQFLCGGTIINNKYILTAAHCVYEKTVIEVRVGEYDLSSPTDCEQLFPNHRDCAPPAQDHIVEETTIHSDYDPRRGLNDIALLRLQNSIDFNNNTQPICLPMISGSSGTNLAGRSLVVTGWGVTNEGNTSQILMKAEIPVLSDDNCQQRLQSISRMVLTDRQICAHDSNGADSCQSDSGGPFQGFEYLYDDIRYVQYGIVSYGPARCGEGNVPGVYTRTEYYVDWILSQLMP